MKGFTWLGKMVLLPSLMRISCVIELVYVLRDLLVVCGKFLCMFTCSSLGVRVCVVCVYMCVSVVGCASVCLSVYFSDYLSIYRSTYLPIYLSIQLSICLSVYLFISPSNCLFACLPIIFFLKDQATAADESFHGQIPHNETHEFLSMCKYLSKRRCQ